MLLDKNAKQKNEHSNKNIKLMIASVTYSSQFSLFAFLVVLDVVFLSVLDKYNFGWPKATANTASDPLAANDANSANDNSRV